jgi:NAD(P)-dependent dehydrogenase (short-subunit alcohol dehydrogenase family)
VLDGKRAVVLGGTGVLGGAMVRGLTQAGAKIALVGRSPEKLQALADEVGGHAYPCDPSDKASLDACASAAAEGGIDILVSAIGGNQAKATLMPDASPFGLDADALRQVFDLNLFAGAILPILSFGAHMAEGSVITVTSISADLPLSRVGGYGAAKAGVSNFTRWAAVELGRRSEGRVRVNSLQPGFFITDQNRALLTDIATGEPTERGRSILAHTPSGRFGDPQDLVGALIFLASDASRFVTGTVLTVDGGFGAWWGI